MENEVYSQGDYVRMNISQKIEFIHRVHVGELDIWDEYGNESFIWDDFHAVTDELREHPEWFSLEDLLQVMGITNDRCFELSWQNQLAEMIYAAFMHHGKAGVEFYLQHLQDVPQTGQFHGCHIPIQWLVREDKGYDILKEVLGMQSSQTKQIFSEILNVIRPWSDTEEKMRIYEERRAELILLCAEE